MLSWKIVVCNLYNNEDQKAMNLKRTILFPSALYDNSLLQLHPVLF